MPCHVLRFQSGIDLHFLLSCCRGFWPTRKPCARPLHHGLFARLRSEIPDERSHPRAFANEAGSCPMNGREKIASRVINSRQLSQIDFDLLVWTQRSAPGVFCFGNPRALEFARKFEPAYLAILVNRDAQLSVADVYGTDSAKATDRLRAREVTNWSGGKMRSAKNALAVCRKTGRLPGSDCTYTLLESQ